ncbi:MAG TPA: hypothetical protein VMV10_24600 [Pirellulales bacterium]|nr:hypothetical protein [Pirellulales bacterium]
MTVDTAATSSPEPFPEPAESAARLSRLHDALKQLRAKSAATSPLSSIAPSVSTAAVAAAESLPPAPSEAAQQPAALMAPASAEPPLAPAIDAVASQPATESFSLEAWFSTAELRQYRQLAGNLAAHLASGEPAAIAIAALSCRHEAPTIAARLALCLAERQAGEVLLIEPAERSLRPIGDAPCASLVEVVGGRADWRDAVAPGVMAGLSLIEFGCAASPDDAPLNDQWRTALADLKRQFRYIVSPIRPGESFAGDAWLAAIDGVYLAVGLGDAPRGMVAACQAQLKACGARLLGCIALK